MSQLNKRGTKKKQTMITIVLTEIYDEGKRKKKQDQTWYQLSLYFISNNFKTGNNNNEIIEQHKK